MKCIILILALLTLTVFGRGYVQLTPGYHYPTSQFEPKLAFGIYQPLLGGLAYDGWVGGGAYLGNGTLWGAATQRLHVPLAERLTLSPGFIFRASASQNPELQRFLSNSEMNVSITYDLW